ncbi:MAG: hypothetical protein E7046_14580, partial [Lentisphaerae bacterium]|nr:hypothetical protein [Lentisphaerota bacterium]
MKMKTVAYLLCGFSVAALMQQASADMVDISSAKIVRAKKENPQQKFAADELEKHLKLIAGRTGDGEGFRFVFGRPSGTKSVQ